MIRGQILSRLRHRCLDAWNLSSARPGIGPEVILNASMNAPVVVHPQLSIPRIRGQFRDLVRRKQPMSNRKVSFGNYLAR
jgi:hypothetical protein